MGGNTDLVPFQQTDEPSQPSALLPPEISYLKRRPFHTPHAWRMRILLTHPAPRMDPPSGMPKRTVTHTFGV